jgi:hypothetical protein
MWIDDSEKLAYTDHEWKLICSTAIAAHDYLQKKGDPNWFDAYDRVFDRIMDRAENGRLSPVAKVPHFYMYLIREEAASAKPVNIEFQVSRNRWKNLKVQEKFDIRSALKEAVIDGDYTLTPIEGFILLARYTMGMSFKAIGEILEYDRQFISQSLDAIAEKLILEMGERVQVHVAPEPKPIVRKEQKFDARYIPGGHRRAR